MSPRVPIDRKTIERFCRKWGVAEFALFGSVLREDFRPDSDVDVLVTFQPGRGVNFSNRVEIQDELEGLFGRRVDLVVSEALRNPFRRSAILRTREVLYAA